MKQVKLTEQQLNEIAQMLDIAVKAGGLQVAATCVTLLTVLRSAEDVEDTDPE